jgi:ubiquinone biosynthesis protein
MMRASGIAERPENHPLLSTPYHQVRESMAKSSTPAATLNFQPGELFFILSKEHPVEERTRKAQQLLERQNSRGFREEISRRVLQYVPTEALVPELYKLWRPLVYDCMFFMMSRLSAPRLAPKLIEQLDMPVDTKPEERLLRLIAKVPGLQKLGQVLARNRNLPPALRRALTRLENGIRDVSAGEIQATIRKELGGKLDECAVQVRPSIYVEASVSAVVRFTWRNPKIHRRERGVFKVLKPYVADFFSEDMDLLARLAKHLGARHRKYGFRPHVLPDIFNDVRLLLQHEVDFTREQSTLKKVAELYRTVPGISVPRVIGPLCTARITALTEERGKKITDAVAHLPAWRRAKVAEQLIDAVIAVPLFAPAGDVLFHADPHAGNLLYDSRTSELTLLDWALTENLRLDQRRKLAMLFLMVLLRDPVGASDAILALSPSGGRREATKAKQIREEVNRYLNELPVKRMPRATDAMNLLETIAWQGVRLPRSLLMFRKALFTLDGILHDIDAPDFSMQSVMLRHLVKTWMAASRNIGAPLSLGDWLLVQCSALLFPGRLGLQGLQTMLERPPRTAVPAMR